MSPDDKDSGFGEVFEPPLSLWKLVEEHVPASERLEIRKILGEHAIDLSLELHREVDTWLKVRHELRSGTFYGDRLPGPSSRPALADPPLIKDMLKEEIRLLLMSVRQRAHSEGRDENKAIAKYNPKVVHFVMSSSRSGSRICQLGSAIGKHGVEEVPSRIQTARDSKDERTGSSLEDTLETIKEKLNISSIDEVVAHLRSVLEEECQSLKREIAFLQSFIMREKDYTDLMAPDPTLTELKEERRVIKQDLQLKPWVRSSRPSHKAVLPKNADESIRPVDLMFQSSAAEMFHGGISCSHPDSVSLKNTRGSKVSSCLVGLKFKNHTFKASRASICSGAHGHRPKVIPLKCAPPTSDKARGQEQVAAEVVCVLPGNSGYSAITLDSRTSSNESFQMRASSCPSADSILGQLPHIRLKLSGVKTAIVPTPPSNQRSSFSSSAIAYRKMRCLQSNSAT
uniref:Coiled-coil domain-containing protein 24 isoform X1 n=1 Tax=Geotrypetes seraphini TaxID=260995 RepID=A0A6P8NWF0_GEOSA|nr:coiled-coil domain-containing protein 24 isoform X1 [Geotrypetes seraphini]XP_033773071.1 coiled-coil domain-containing protein 24 isoform X1 [Geotrypetes seraphini]